ncbi:MAG TPA: hypothetical protein VF252_08220 [Gemmatimonadales bacterium]
MLFLTLVILALYYLAAHWLGGWPLVGILLAADVVGGGWPLALVASLAYLAFIGNWMGLGLVAGFALMTLVIVGVYAEREARWSP